METVMKVDPWMYNRTAELINLVNKLGDDGYPVEPMWTGPRKDNYYPDSKESREPKSKECRDKKTWPGIYDRYNNKTKHNCTPEFNLDFIDTNEPIDVYRDLVKVLIDTNVHGITGTKPEFATTLAPAPLRKSIRRQRVMNPEVLELYQRKSKKDFRSTSDDSDDSDDDSDESLGFYRRTISSEEDDYDRWEVIRRMREINKILPAPKVSELNFDKLSSRHDETTFLRSYYVGESNGKQDNWNQDDGSDSFKNSVSLDNQDAEDKLSNSKKTEKSALDEPNVVRNKKTINKWGKSKNKDRDNIRSNNNNKNKGKNKNEKLKKTDENKKTISNNAKKVENNWNKNKTANWSGKSLESDGWQKQEQDKKVEENERYKHKPKNNNLVKNVLNEAKILDGGELHITQRSANDNNRHQRNFDDKSDDNENSNKKEQETEQNKNNWDSPIKNGWDDYGPSFENEKNLSSDTKIDKRDNIERSKKDSLDKKGSWESNTKNKEEDRYSKRTKKDDRDKSFKQKSIWDSVPLEKDSRYEKTTKKEKWNDKTMQKERWDDEKPKKDWDNRSTKKGSWDDMSVRNDKSNDWNDKPKKKDSWEYKPVKKYSSNNWSNQREKTTNRWKDWGPPPTRKKKYENDYYGRPWNKHIKRGRDMLNVRTPIPYRGKKGIYENV